jgi:S1-C subfamily serine protease
MVREMNRLIVVFTVILMALVTLAPVGCQQSTPDIIEVIAIFPAESGSPPPTGAWAYDRKSDPHPDRIQRVFNLGDRMFLGLRISEHLEADITFSEYTFFNRDTAKEIEVGLPGALGPFEPGRVILAGFENPWMVPADPGNYELRIYLDNKVVASARFEVSTGISRQPVVMVKSQLTGGRSGQSSGFIFRSDGSIVTFLADVSEVEKLEVVLSNGYPLEASVSRTGNATSLASIKVGRDNLVPFTLAGNNEIAELQAGTHLFAAGYSDGEYLEIEVEVLDTKYNLLLPEGKELRVMKLDAGGEPGIAGGPVVNTAGHVVGVMLSFVSETNESFMIPISRIPSVLFLPTTAQEVTSDTQPISREQAIEAAVRGLPPSIVARADINAEVHGWYWEITFDNLNAKADELMPYPLKPPPPGPTGKVTTDPYPGIWQSVIITVDAQTGAPRSTGARKVPRPGPYVSEEQAIESAREGVLGFPMDASWIARAKVEAYLQGDIWVVLFWEEGSQDNRIKARVDAVTGDFKGGGVG